MSMVFRQYSRQTSVLAYSQWITVSVNPPLQFLTFSWQIEAKVNRVNCFSSIFAQNIHSRLFLANKDKCKPGFTITLPIWSLVLREGGRRGGGLVSNACFLLNKIFYNHILFLPIIKIAWYLLQNVIQFKFGPAVLPDVWIYPYMYGLFEFWKSTFEQILGKTDFFGQRRIFYLHFLEKWTFYTDFFSRIWIFLLIWITRWKRISI